MNFMHMDESLLAAKPRPHIAFVLPGLGAGGSEHIVSLLCNYFAELEWTVTLLAFEERDVLPYYRHHPVVRIIKLGNRAQKASLAGGLRNVYARVRLLAKAFE